MLTSLGEVDLVGKGGEATLTTMVAKIMLLKVVEAFIEGEGTSLLTEGAPQGVSSRGEEASTIIEVA